MAYANTRKHNIRLVICYYVTLIIFIFIYLLLRMCITYVMFYYVTTSIQHNNYVITHVTYSLSPSFTIPPSSHSNH